MKIDQFAATMKEENSGSPLTRALQSLRGLSAAQIESLKSDFSVWIPWAEEAKTLAQDS